MLILQGLAGTMTRSAVPWKKAVFGLGNRRSIRLSYGTEKPASIDAGA
jgi:hypothetical protein